MKRRRYVRRHRESTAAAQRRQWQLVPIVVGVAAVAAVTAATVAVVAAVVDVAAAMTGAAATGQRGVQVRRTGEHTGRAAHTGTRSTRGSIWAGRAAVHGQLGQCVGSWARGLRRAAGRAGRAWQQGARGARIAERTGRTGQQEARGSERGVRGAAYRARAGLQTGRAHGSVRGAR
ncbi:unnamed protein product [Closterium sp. NIES-65]|nr:unnamed protein product [Closterium sp. NIES-65]